MDVTEIVRRYILRREATGLVPGPRPGPDPRPHPPRSGSDWDPSLATGIERIDQQHQELMVTIQEFQNAAKGGSGFRSLNVTVGLLVRYADDHFTLEESYMAHIKYPDLPEHREEHAALRKRIRALHQRLGASDPAKVMELSAQLCQSLRDHFLRDDGLYMAFARRM
jgi:hemerythrin-like metal-binding protein